MRSCQFIRASTLAILACVAFVPAASSQERDAPIVTEERRAGNNPQKKYFLIRHKVAPQQTLKEFGLLLILPGGSGGADFLPFCANVLTASSVPKDFVAAQLVAPVWKKLDDSSVIWPSKAFPVREAQFTTEQFVDDVIGDVSKSLKLHAGWIFMLGWSSSGHVLYSTAIENSKVRGFFVAMSRFRPEWFRDLRRAKGKRFYLWHSPEDAVCSFAEAKDASEALTKAGASTVLKSYQGGHGWMPFTFYGDRIKEAIEWMRLPETEAESFRKKLNESPTAK